MNEHPANDEQGNPAGSHDLLAERGEQVPSIAIFAERRKELGLSHDDVANQLKFAPRLIEALEAGEFDKLPGRTFARGMLRTYAKLLKIDPSPFLAQLGNTPTAPVITEQTLSLRAPVPFAESSRHNMMYVALSCCVLAGAAYFAAEWYFTKDSPSTMAFVAPGRETPAPAVAAPQPQADAAVTPQSAPPQTAAPPVAGTPTTLASAGPVPVPETTPRADAAAAETKPPLPPGKGRIVIKFDKESWVEIKGKNGTLLSQLNPAGSEKTIEGDPPFQLTIGNAPSVHVTYNDQPVDLKPHFKVDVARLTLN